MGNTFYFEWEVALQEWIQAHMGSFGGVLATIMTMLGEELFMILILGFIYWCYDKEFGKIMGTNVTAAVAWNPLIKGIFLRRRPYFDHKAIKCIRAVESDAPIDDIVAQGYSFPSGHSMNAATVYGTIAYMKKHKFLVICGFVLPFLVGLSRVMLGVHYATDVLVGWAVGVGLTFGMTILQMKIKRRWILHLVIFIVTAIGCFYVRTNDYFTALGIMGGFFLACPFEEKFVNFKNTKSVPKCILRILCGLIIYLVLNVGMKLPFSDEFLHGKSFGCFAFRVFRYAVIVFVMLGVYPLAFDKIHLKKKTEVKEETEVNEEAEAEKETVEQ